MHNLRGSCTVISLMDHKHTTKNMCKWQPVMDNYNGNWPVPASCCRFFNLQCEKRKKKHLTVQRDIGQSVTT